MERESAPQETTEERLERLMETYGDGMLRMCILQLRDRGLAEDAVQDSFCKAYLHLKDFRGECSEKTWLMRIAVNTCRDYRRRAWLRHVQVSDEVEALLPCAQASSPDPEGAVLDAVMHLPAREREAVLLRYYQQMKVSEVARALGVPENTAASRLSRARAKLRTRLKGWYFDEEF